MTNPNSTGKVWYVTSARTAINWGTAVSGGLATVDIFRMVDVANSTNDDVSLWRRTGQKVSAAEVAAAQAETSADAIPAAHTPSSNSGVKFSGKKRPATPNATDLATAITLANALKGDLVALGLKAP